jgi:hypothetical protein
MEPYTITPEVDAVREFLEIAGDFTNPLEVVREAISNSIDAGATEISIDFSAPKEVGTYVLHIQVQDAVTEWTQRISSRSLISAAPPNAAGPN